MKKILIVADSLGYPRMHPEILTDEDCWSFKVSDNFSSLYRIRTWLRPGLDTEQLINDTNQHLSSIKEPDIVILQIGIVDCYPRALKKNELSLILRLPKLVSSLVHKIVKRYYKLLINRRNICYVKPALFEENLLKFRAHFIKAKFIVIPIAPPSTSYEKKNPLVKDAISKYNKILYTVFGDDLLDDVYSVSSDYFLMSDGHHINYLGNQLIYSSVSNVIEKNAV